MTRAKHSEPGGQMSLMDFQDSRFLSGTEVGQLAALLEGCRRASVDLETTGTSPWHCPTKSVGLQATGFMKGRVEKATARLVLDEPATIRVLSAGVIETDIPPDLIATADMLPHVAADVPGPDGEPVRIRCYAADVTRGSREQVQTLFKTALDLPEIIGQNLLFDFAFLQHAVGSDGGLTFPETIHDTYLRVRVMEAGVSQGTGFALDDLAARYVPDLKPWEKAFPGFLDKGYQHPTFWLPQVQLTADHYAYASKDPAMAFAVYWGQETALKRMEETGGTEAVSAKLFRRMFQLEGEAQKKATEMNYRGIPVSKRVLQDVIKRYETDYTEFCRQFVEMPEFKGITIGKLTLAGHLAKKGGLAKQLKKALVDLIPLDRLVPTERGANREWFNMVEEVRATIKDGSFEMKKFQLRNKYEKTILGSAAVGKKELTVAGVSETPWARAWLGLSQHAKRLTYLKQYLDCARDDSHIHSAIKSLHAISGRMASENPNLQNIPRNLKELLLRPKPGNVVVLVDWSQIELKIATLLAGRLVYRERKWQKEVPPLEQGKRHPGLWVYTPIGSLKGEHGLNEQTELLKICGMLKVINQGYDLHEVTAAKRMGITVEEIRRRFKLKDSTDPEELALFKGVKDGRQGAKGINFGAVYGQMPKGLKDYVKFTYGVDMTLEEATEARRQFMELYPEIDKWHRILMRLMRMNRENGQRMPLRTMGGRLVMAKNMNDAASLPVQGTGADMLKLALSRLHDVHLINCVHDEIVSEAPVDDAERVANKIVEEMERAGRDLLGASLVATTEASIIDSTGKKRVLEDWLKLPREDRGLKAIEDDIPMVIELPVGGIDEAEEAEEEESLTE